MFLGGKALSVITRICGKARTTKKKTKKKKKKERMVIIKSNTRLNWISGNWMLRGETAEDNDNQRQEKGYGTYKPESAVIKDTTQ